MRRLFSLDCHRAASAVIHHSRPGNSRVVLAVYHHGIFRKHDHLVFGENLGLAACSSGASEPEEVSSTETTAEGESNTDAQGSTGLKIGLAVQTLSNQVWAQQAERIQQDAEADGNEVTVVDCKENANTQIEGLKTYALGTDVKSYRITTTFRLTKASADLTGIFYSNRFRSVQKKEIDFSLCHSNLFPSGGGVIYHYTHDFTNGIVSGTGLNIVNKVVNAFSRNYPKRSLAIISPFNDTVKQLQKSFLTDSSLDDFTIETIDRIQGMTVDYAILYIPGRNPGFALDERRFNVATSRSRSTTLIVSDIPLTNMHSISPKVANFIRKCQSLDDISVMDSKEPDNMFDVLERNDIKVLYPGMETIVDLLIDNNIPFSHDGDVDLLDKDGVVIATAGMLLKEYNIAINPVDNDSRKIFERAGYNVISSDEFSVELVKR